MDGGSKMSARCLFFSSTVARERKARCHIRRFIGPLCCRLIPLRAVLFARLLHLLPLKINSLALPCAPPAAPARARARARERPPLPLPATPRSSSRSLSLSLSRFFSFFLSLALLLSFPRSFSCFSRSRFTSCNATDTFTRTFEPLSRAFSRTFRARRPTDQPLDSLESRRWHRVAARRRLSPLPPPPPPPPPLWMMVMVMVVMMMMMTTRL